MPNPNPRTDQLTPLPRADNTTGELAPIALSARVEVDVDALVRQLPNRSEWLRRVITEAAQRELLNPDDEVKS
jgi:hypothetical protein